MRKPISKRRRFNVFKRDNFTCQYCGRKPPVVVLEVDHIVPVCEGGCDDTFNLTSACYDCNRGKAGVPLTKIPDHQTLNITLENERVEQINALNRFLKRKRTRERADVEDVGEYWFSFFKPRENLLFAGQMEISVRGFLKRLPKQEVLDGVDITQRKFAGRSVSWQYAFKYFCGVCWKKIRRMDGVNE